MNLTAIPEPGTYDAPQMITLLCSQPGAEIHYTRDGSTPGPDSPVFDPYRLIPMYEFGQAVPEGRSQFLIRAVTVAGGQVGPEQTFLYELCPRGRDEYLSEEVAPGVRMIRDYENDKLYLVTGSQRALLIDAGMGSGDLRGYIKPFLQGLPLDVVITHAHPDHIARIDQFQLDCDVYMHHDDLPMLRMFAQNMYPAIKPENIVNLCEGFLFDLGDRKLRIYEVPGHSKGCIVLLDEGNGILFSGDALGSNRPTIVDALWMQRSEMMIDEYLSVLQVFRSKVAGKVKVIFGGHNDSGLPGEAYLDSLQEAAQKLVDQGPGVLTPSPRPTGAWQVVHGDRLSDPYWAAINVNSERCLSAPPEQIASLSNLQVICGSLFPGFHPSEDDYTVIIESCAVPLAIIPTATSRRCAALTINGVPAVSGEPFALPPIGGKAFRPVVIQVTSPDGTVTQTYTVHIHFA